MSVLRGFKLTLPNGNTYRAKHNVVTDNNQEWSFLFNGGNNLLALWEQFAGSGRGNDGLKQSAYIGTGAGSRRFSIEFVQFEGSTETWGGEAGSDMETLRDTLDHDLATVSISSRKTATLEQGEFSTAGKYSPIEVVALSSSLRVNYPEDTSVMNGTIELGEAADLLEVNTAEGETG